MIFTANFLLKVSLVNTFIHSRSFTGIQTMLLQEKIFMIFLGDGKDYKYWRCKLQSSGD